jgi:hypothetical protein
LSAAGRDKASVAARSIYFHAFPIQSPDPQANTFHNINCFFFHLTTSIKNTFERLGKIGNIKGIKTVKISSLLHNAL